MFSGIGTTKNVLPNNSSYLRQIQTTVHRYWSRVTLKVASFVCAVGNFFSAAINGGADLVNRVIKKLKTKKNGIFSNYAHSPDKTFQ